MDWQQTPFYMFFIILPNGGSIYHKIHESYPLQIETDQLLGLISIFFSLNNLQTGQVHPDIISNRKDQIDLFHKNYIKSFTATAFQIKVLDTIGQLKFVLMTGIHIQSKKIDSKLQQIYKIFVNYVIKAPFFKVQQYVKSQTFKKKSNQILYR